MAQFDFDLFTIGGGSGGVRAGRVSASYGARVAVAENGRFGGTCVNVGCIPKKLFSYAAHYREEFEIARAYGWTADEQRFDWRTLLANKDREIARLNGIYERLLTNAGATILRERAVLRGPNELEAGGKTYTAKHILVATGSWHRCPGYRAASLRSLRTRRFTWRGCLSQRSSWAAGTSRSSSRRSSMAWA